MRGKIATAYSPVRCRQFSKMKKYIIGIILLIALTTFLIVRLTQYNTWIDKHDECFMDDGPCLGKKVKIDKNSYVIIEQIEVPNGTIAIMKEKQSFSDTVPPTLVRFDNTHEILWAVSLDTKQSGCEIPLFKMSGLTLSKNNSGKKITFFNETHGEPGAIYLTKEYDFELHVLENVLAKKKLPTTSAVVNGGFRSKLYIFT